MVYFIFTYTFTPPKLPPKHHAVYIEHLKPLETPKRVAQNAGSPGLRFGRRGVGDRRLVRFLGELELLRRRSGRRSAKPPRPGRNWLKPLLGGSSQSVSVVTIHLQMVNFPLVMLVFAGVIGEAWYFPGPLLGGWAPS